MKVNLTSRIPVTLPFRTATATTRGMDQTTEALANMLQKKEVSKVRRRENSWTRRFPESQQGVFGCLGLALEVERMKRPTSEDDTRKGCISQIETDRMAGRWHAGSLKKNAKGKG